MNACFDLSTEPVLPIKVLLLDLFKLSEFALQLGQTLMNILPTQFEMLSKLADVASLRHRITSNNVANINTPGYRRMVVKFEDTLAEQLRKPGPVDVSRLKPELFEDIAGPMRVDGNNVDINIESGVLNKNTLLYNAYIQMLSTKMAMMRRAVNSA